MAYIFGMPDRKPKMLRIRFTCNGQTTPGQQSLENGVADLRCERNADLGYSSGYCGAGAPGGAGARRQSPVMMPPRPPVVDDTASPPSFLL